MKELNPNLARGLRWPAALPPFYPPPTKGPCQATGQGVKKVLSALQSSPACNPFLKMSDVSLPYKHPRAHFDQNL